MPFYISKARPHTHQACRSLLQKAVRRGDVELTRQTAEHLLAAGDASWLRQRTGVIVFEECWPLAAELDWAPKASAVVERLVHAAASVKVKDATGLGSMAHLLANGEQSVLTGGVTDEPIQRVAQAIADPSSFWVWAREQAEGERVRLLVEAAQQAHRRGGWPWDQAFILAGTYLAVTEGIPAVQAAEPPAPPFPYWVALDRHTPQGKVVLRAVAKREGFPLRQLLWTSFYFEGAVTNEATASWWWDTEVAWRLARVGLNEETGRRFWEQARPFVAAALAEEAETLRQHVAETALVGSA